MRILFIFSRHSTNPNDSTLTKDLSDEFSKQGHEVAVVTMEEKRSGKNTELKIENGYKVLRIKTGNYFNVNKIEKGITVFTMPYKLKKGIVEKFKDKKFDLIITHTPFMANPYLINSLKKYFNCPAYLILWDIFPQNAKDIGIITNPVLFNYFKMKEHKMMKAFDKILCMSEGNVEYVRSNYEYLKKENITLLRNWALMKPRIEVKREEILEKYGYKQEDFIGIFGGNMGKPQKLENIIELAERALKIENMKFLFVGNGTEKNSLQKLAEDKKLTNIKFLEQVPREDYEKLTAACDIGLVSLDERFTVPNFPSKTTDYFKLGLPILASLDSCAAKDYGNFLQNKVKGGLYSLAEDKANLFKQLMKLYENKELRAEMGNNGRRYYEENLGSDLAYKTIIKNIDIAQGDESGCLKTKYC